MCRAEPPQQKPAALLRKPRYCIKQPDERHFDVRSTLIYWPELISRKFTVLDRFLRCVCCRMRYRSFPLTQGKAFHLRPHRSRWAAKLGAQSAVRAERKTNNRVTMSLRLAAVTLRRTHTALAGFCRRLACPYWHRQSGDRDGTKTRCIVLQLHALRNELQRPGADHCEQQYRNRVLKQLHRRAAQFGLILQL